jgi:hypothetical protein
MSLFIDTDLRLIPELACYESSIVDVANTEGIDLSAKVEIAKAEVGLKLQKFFEGLSGSDPNSEWQSPTARKLTIANVVVTDALKVWNIYEVLAVTYRDAFHRQLNTRYEALYQEFSKLTESAERTCLDVGVEIVYNPIPAGCAVSTTIPGGPVTGGGWFLSIAWTGANGAEGMPGPIIQYAVPEGVSMAVNVVNPPSNASGWNLYAGQTEASLSLQNDAPIQVDSDWSLPLSGFRAGVRPGTGQKPDQILKRKRVLRRG